ncbi:hypothetical protein BGX21_009321 [Mortierella sp. AD011]|nr:hypothetical protein BGX20_005377 [Mortierella sp. AD010]KAF9397054.1 hypothetical protein BGX21_009321 [Mortierella sp. AD011]
MPSFETWTSSSQNPIQDLSSTNSAVMENQGWGFEFDVEAMAKDSVTPPIQSTEAIQHKDDRRVNNNSRGGDSGTSDWFRQVDPTYQDNRSSSNEDIEGFRKQGRDRDLAVEHGPDNWGRQHHWFSEATSSRFKDDVHVKEEEEEEDVWDIGGVEQWSVSETNLPQDQGNGNNEEEEPPLDELTKYWVTENDLDKIRFNSKRLHRPFSDTPKVNQYDGDSWGSVPEPVMSYNGEDYISDVLIEQSKRKFFTLRDGTWELLNQSTDTKITYNRCHPLPEDMAGSSRRIDSFNPNKNFQLEPYDFESEGFVGEDDWKKPKRGLRADSKEGEGEEEEGEEEEEKEEPPIKTEMIESLLDMDLQEKEADEHVGNERNNFNHEQKDSFNNCSTGLLVDLTTSPPTTPEPRHETPLELASPHDWLNQIAKKNQEHFQESQEIHKEEWSALMEKQEQDSKRLHDFIQQTSKPKTRKKTKVSTPISLTIVIETKEFGQQEIHVTGEEDLKPLVDDFCQKFKMESYEMALWVTVARAVHKQKKKLRGQQRAEGLV